MAILPGAEPFFFRGGERGVLLVHGFTGSPSEMRLLGEYLHRQGYTVLGPRLCGHGTSPAEMAATSWPLWYGAVEDGYHMLKDICQEVAVVGLSMGALLALKLAAEQPVTAAVSLCAPIFLAEKRLRWLPLYRLLRRFHPKKRRTLANVDPSYSICYELTPLASLQQLLQLIEQVKRLLPNLTVPLLIMQSRHDHTVQPRSADYIYETAAAAARELIWLKNSGHIITLDVEHELVFAQIERFLAAGWQE